LSKDYYQFKNEKGDIAFLIGLVDYLSDRLSLICDFGYTLEADVFAVSDQDLSLLSESVRKRVYLYSEQTGNFDKDTISNIDFDLKKMDGTDVVDYMYAKMKTYSSSSALLEEIEEFFSTLRWQLGHPIGIYEPVQMPDENITILSNVYISLAWDYCFIEYDGFVVMVIWGTAE